MHGFPFDSESWEKQTRVLLAAGHRVIRYDRRGFGRSSRPAGGYDYDALAGDLATLLERLNASDAVLVGASVGTGEIIRYLGTRGSQRIRKAVLISTVAPAPLRSCDNPDGVEESMIEAAEAAVPADRPEWLSRFLDRAFDPGEPATARAGGGPATSRAGGRAATGRASDAARQAAFITAAAAAPQAVSASIEAWRSDFHGDLARIDVPVLLLHGDADRILPIDATANRLPELIGDLRFEVIPAGPHALNWVCPEQVNHHILCFAAS
ncbi:alpha/beta hydrolase [Actinoplanes missouriensis]|uniref:alpha/beta fold hydrolase n=1 Tax=Actinoplanes missouriensis TaxID=1866 RepID=UPI0033C19B91